MKKTAKKQFTILLVIVMIISMFPLYVSANQSVDISAVSLTNLRNAVSTASFGETVTVSGTASSTVTLSLNIPEGVTVVWGAAFSGTPSPLIDVYGKGSFRVVPGGNIENTGTGNSYIALRANDDIFVEISGGTVKAGLGTAIEGTGAGTTVTVSGGSVVNTATHNLRPVINMTNPNLTPAYVPPDPPPVNVTVNGGTVSARAVGDTVYGYAIQTYGSVLVDGDGEVSTYGGYGRGINLVGKYSVAWIAGGKVVASGVNGVAISTATTTGVDV